MNNFKPVTTRFKTFLFNDVPSQCFSFVDRDSTPTIIQIGAHDGIVGEEYGFQEFLSELDSFNLFLIEPLKKYYEKLPDVYEKFSGENKKITYCNFAIADFDGYSDMVDLGGCSRIVQSGAGEQLVSSKNWNTFVRENSIDKIDLLLIDCEGYEFSILKSINYNILKPKSIRYEFYHIPDKLATDNFLMTQGYSISLCETDPTYNKIAVV